jgi:Predicted membrane protein
MIGGFSLYEICLYFMEYSFFGWILEVLYHAITKGKVVNRGFLNGPVCPIYGFGAVGVLMLSNGIDALSTQVNDMTSSLNNLTLFFGGMIIATLIELFGGWLLDKLFHTRWWNYSERRFNLHGYICPEFSILWGLAIMFCVRIIQPLMVHSTNALLPSSIGWPILAVLYGILFIDLIVTTLTVQGWNKKLAELDKIREAMRKPSDLMTATIAEPAIITSQHVDETKVQGALAKAELNDKVATAAEQVKEQLAIQQAEYEARIDELSKKKQQLLDDLMNHGHKHGVRRIFNAFPQLEQHKYNEALQEVKEAFKKKFQ